MTEYRVNILGTIYNITYKDDKDDPVLVGASGYMDPSTHTIVINNDTCGAGDGRARQRRIMRHEIIHAFLYESGLYDSNSWDEEQMVDYFAIQWNKINKIFEELEIND